MALRPWSILARFHPYKEVTREVARVDHRTLQGVPHEKLYELRKWEKTITLRKTHHLVEQRLKPYVNKVSRSKAYVEVTPEEYAWVQQARFEPPICDGTAQLVEVGFNSDRRVCKAGYVLKMPSGRHLFLCVGMDGGIKTLYVTPHFKDRAHYNGCKYLSIEEATAI